MKNIVSKVRISQDHFCTVMALLMCPYFLIPTEYPNTNYKICNEKINVLKSISYINVNCKIADL